MFLPTSRPPHTPEEDSISVEILTPQQFEARPEKPVSNVLSSGPVPHQPVPDSVTESALPPPSLPEKAEPISGQTVRPKRFFSKQILADPRSRAALLSLEQLSTDERIVQLCNVEAMEQVRRWNAAFRPDFLVAYAMADVSLTAQEIQANGGAFRSDRRWYNIKYKCQVAPANDDVVAFEFSVGDEIPESAWKAHNLTVDDAPADQHTLTAEKPIQPVPDL